MPDLLAPVQVSLLIKFFRYAFLIPGIFYGAGKLKALRALEASRPEEAARKRALRAAQLAEEKQLAAERDFEQIVEIFRPLPNVGALGPSGLKQETVLEPGSTSDVQFEGLYNKPLGLTEQEPDRYVIEDFEKAPILRLEDGECRTPPE
ncbi:uncharacterized protein LOC109543445 [Dendroctonus ponderosae]|uniref:ATP synthase F(0) complex subunit e, mitochondrial n=1 Tax=Dendroctonus ponderosae TaxID=77166 RepID=A0AAR5Q657_DENPD|nr:uncharacterized protein LOC109543445 [Dendroctonus ponderosae]KAH1022756.1 hypothetical protein HUJ04_012103 [Dendroctonus ponderosae]KAH1029283.1 hypothetical protein HUJ05_002544 [Dendroctonus ponderosae]